jgi:hypothetical protein
MYSSMISSVVLMQILIRSVVRFKSGGWWTERQSVYIWIHFPTTPPRPFLASSWAPSCSIRQARCSAVCHVAPTLTDPQFFDAVSEPKGQVATPLALLTPAQPSSPADATTAAASMASSSATEPSDRVPDRSTLSSRFA